MNIYQRKSIISRIVYGFLAVFLLFVGFGLVFASSSDFVVSNLLQTHKQVNQDPSIVKPKKIYIPALNRIIDISDGYTSGNRWTVAETGVSHLTTSSVPGSAGNAVLYGHNKDKVLGKLWKVQYGDLIYIIFSF